jgi:hypothetical protein
LIDSSSDGEPHVGDVASDDSFDFFAKEQCFLRALYRKARRRDCNDNEQSQVLSGRGPVSYAYPSGLFAQAFSVSEKPDVIHTICEVAMPCKCFALKHSSNARSI